MNTEQIEKTITPKPAPLKGNTKDRDKAHAKLPFPTGKKPGKFIDDPNIEKTVQLGYD